MGLVSPRMGTRMGTLTGVLSVKNFGATGNGTGEGDDAAFQEALKSSAEDTYHRPVFVPPGFYKPTTSMAMFSGMSVIGLAPTRDQERTVVENSTADTFHLTASTNDVVIENITFQGNSSTKATNWLTPVNLGTGFVLEYSRITGCGMRYYTNVINGRLLGANIDNNYVNDTIKPALIMAGSDCMIQRNFISTSGGTTNSEFVVQSTLSRSQIENNYITGSVSMPLFVGKSTNSIYALNQIDGSPSGTEGAGVYILEAEGHQFVGNSVVGCVTAPFAQYGGGITLYDSSDVSFLGTVFEQAGHDAFIIGQSGGTTTNIKILGSQYHGGVSTKIATVGTVTNLYAPEEMGPLANVLNVGAKTSAEIDALFPFTPPTGTIAIDNTSKLYLQRGSSKWFKSAALTEIA